MKERNKKTLKDKGRAGDAAQLVETSTQKQMCSISNTT